MQILHDYLGDFSGKWNLLDQEFTVFSCVYRDVGNVGRSHFARNAMSRRESILTDERLVGTLYLSESQMHPYWCVDLAGNVSHVS